MRHNCFEWPARIKAVDLEYAAMRLAADRPLKEARSDPTILTGELKMRDIVDASRCLEGTYGIRLFAEFETGLRSFWHTIKDTEPATHDLLSGIAT
jgi:hypothetical protein